MICSMLRLFGLPGRRWVLSDTSGVKRLRNTQATVTLSNASMSCDPMATSAFDPFDITDASLFGFGLDPFLDTTWAAGDWLALPDTDTSGERGRGGRGGRRRWNRAIPVDIIEFNDKYEVKADVPGVKKDKIKLNVDGTTIRIGVDRTEPEESMPDANYFRGERPTGYITRNITLPDDADMDKIDASYNDGVLVITVPKKEGAKREPPRAVQVK